MKLTAAVEGRTVKENKLVLFAVNGILMIPYIAHNYSLAGALSSLMIFLLLFAILFKSNHTMAASAYLPVVIVADVGSYIGIHFEVLKQVFEVENLLDLFMNLDRTAWILAAVGAGLALLGMYKENITWISGIGGTVILVVLALNIWSNCDFSQLSFYGYGKTLLTLIIIGGLFWTILIHLITITTPAKRESSLLIGILFMVAVTVFMAAENQYVEMMAGQWTDSLLNISGGFLAWWKVVLAVVVLLCGIFVLYIIDGANGNHLSIDAYALILSAELIFSIRFLLSNFFSYNWLLLFVVVVGTFRCIKNDYSGRKTLCLDSIFYLSAQYLAFIVCVMFLKRGLWINVVVTIVFGTVFYNEAIQEKKKNYHQSHWIMVIICIICQTLAWVWKFRFSVSSLAIIAFLLGFSTCTMIVINMGHPNSMSVPNSSRHMICAGLVLLCLLTMSKYGTKIKIQKASAENTVNIMIGARGKENMVENAYYYWRDQLGRIVSDECLIGNVETEIEIQDEILTVVTTDAHGIRTTVYYWYPHWLLED